MQKHGDEKDRGFVQRCISASSWRERRQHGKGLGQMTERHAKDRSQSAL